MTPEQNFWNLIKKHLPGKISRIENTVDVGTPDVSGSYVNKDYWVELKVCQNKNKEIEPIKLLRSTQIIWHLQRRDSLIFVLVRYPKKILAYELVGNAYLKLFTLTKVKNKFNWELFTEVFKIAIIGE